MTDRPIAAVLAALAAAMSRRRVLGGRRDAPRQRRRSADERAARTAPADGDRRGAAWPRCVAPSLSRVAALPALHLPKERKPAKKKAKPKTATTPTPTPRR